MSLRPKSLILATVEDPGNVRSWSGIPFALRAALERQVDTLTVFRPSRPYRSPLDVALRLALGGKPLRGPLWMTSVSSGPMIRRSLESRSSWTRRGNSRVKIRD